MASAASQHRYHFAQQVHLIPPTEEYPDDAQYTRTERDDLVFASDPHAHHLNFPSSAPSLSGSTTSHSSASSTTSGHASRVNNNMQGQDPYGHGDGQALRNGSPPIFLDMEQDSVGMMNGDMNNHYHHQPTGTEPSHVWVKKVLDRNQACLSCRSKKKKCDGMRPVCGNCFRLDRVCVYSHSEDKQPLLGQQRKRAATGSQKRSVRQKTSDDGNGEGGQNAIRNEFAITEDANRQASKELLEYNYGELLPGVSEALGLGSSTALTVPTSPRTSSVGFFGSDYDVDVLDFPMNMDSGFSAPGFIDTGSGNISSFNFRFPSSPGGGGGGFDGFGFLDLERDPVGLFSTFLAPGPDAPSFSIPPSIDINATNTATKIATLREQYPPIDPAVIAAMTNNGTFPPPKEILDQLVDIFFTHYHPFMPFLHKASFVRDIQPKGPLHAPTVLTYAVLSLACRSHPHPAISSVAKQWHRKGKDLFDWCTANGKFCLENVQGALWNCYHGIISAQLCEAWVILAKAYRMATPLELHKLDAHGADLRSILTPLWGPMRMPRGRLEEEARRTFWAMVVLDRWASLPAGWPMCIGDRQWKVDLPVEEEIYQAMTDLDSLAPDASEPYVYNLDKFISISPNLPSRAPSPTFSGSSPQSSIHDYEDEMPVRGALHYTYKLSVLWGRILDFNTDPHIEFSPLHRTGRGEVNEYTSKFRDLESALARMRLLLVNPRKIRQLTNAQFRPWNNAERLAAQKELFVEVAMEMKLHTDIETATILLWHPIVIAYRLQQDAQEKGGIDPHAGTATGRVTREDYETAFNICLRSVENILNTMRSATFYSGGDDESILGRNTLGNYVSHVSFFWQPLLAPTYLLCSRVLVAKWADLKENFFSTVLASSMTPNPGTINLNEVESEIERQRQKIHREVSLILSTFEKFVGYSENLGKAYCGMLGIELEKLKPITRADAPHPYLPRRSATPRDDYADAGFSPPTRASFPAKGPVDSGDPSERGFGAPIWGDKKVAKKTVNTARAWSVQSKAHGNVIYDSDERYGTAGRSPSIYGAEDGWVGLAPNTTNGNTGANVNASANTSSRRSSPGVAQQVWSSNGVQMVNGQGVGMGPQGNGNAFIPVGGNGGGVCLGGDGCGVNMIR